MNTIQTINSELYNRIVSLIQEGRQQVRTAANRALIITYWNIGRLIVEDEQKGNQRAEYGKRVVRDLAKRLTQEFGKGFAYRNLQYMKKFYTFFPIVNAVRSQSPIRNALRSEFQLRF